MEATELSPLLDAYQIIPDSAGSFGGQSLRGTGVLNEEGLRVVAPKVVAEANPEFTLSVASSEIGAAASWLGIAPDEVKMVRIRCLITRLQDVRITFSSRGKPETLAAD